MVIFHLASVMSGQGEKDFDLCWRAAGMKHVVSATLLGRVCSNELLFTHVVGVVVMVVAVLTLMVLLQSLARP